MISWYRLTAQFGHLVGLHKWHCYQDCGDGVNVNPDVPKHLADWCVCTWCGTQISPKQTAQP